jgi:hypothetical protein
VTAAHQVDTGMAGQGQQEVSLPDLAPSAIAVRGVRSYPRNCSHRASTITLGGKDLIAGTITDKPPRPGRRQP